VLTQGRNSVQLFLNGNLQFSSSDEYRYHEALTHPAFSVAPRHARVLVLGGGDGLAVREVFRHEDVREVTLVDLDEGVTRMARTVPSIRALNRGSLDDPRVTLVHDDAMIWLDERTGEPFDVVIVDFPDPNNFSLGKLYTRRFYALLARAMHDDTAVVVQSTSPLYARRSFWCIERTMAAAGLHTAPYHVTVPSFGEWGFVLAMKRPFDHPTLVGVPGLAYLTDEELERLFVFPRDMEALPVEENRLNDQMLVRYYEEEWARWN
jgi:spermidine synthase